MKKFIKFLIGLSSSTWNKFYLKRKSVSYGANFKINGKLLIEGNGKFILGNNVKIHSAKEFNPTGGGCVTSLNSFEGATIKIGDNVGISHTAITAMKSVEIGDNVLIGSNCMIADTDFHPIDPQKRLVNPNDIETTKTAPIKIEKNVFIGARSIILKGVTIGENSVIGAGSVVTKDVPANEIWAGNPAKFVKNV